MKEIEKTLLNKGHKIFLPQKFPNTNYNNKSTSKGAKNIIKYNAIKKHYKNILNSDAILVTNYKKNKIENYIGGNTSLEMGLAYVNDKKIFVFNPLPEKINYLEEMMGMKPIIIDRDLTKIK